VWHPSRKGEDVVALHDRIAGFLKVLIPEVQRRIAGAHKHILLVSHAATVVGLTHELHSTPGDASIRQSIQDLALSKDLNG
jgi:transcription factor C subunit 7